MYYSTKGGTSQRDVGSIYATVNSKTYTLEEIRKVISNTNNLKRISYRQWAALWTNATFIYKVGETYCIPGDLYKKLSRIHTNI